jgi:hypothetical protein
VLGPKASLHSALPVLATQLAGADLRTDARTDASLDLILGDGFKSLTAKPDADKALAALTNPTPTASPGSTGKKSC